MKKPFLSVLFFFVITAGLLLARSDAETVAGDHQAITHVQESFLKSAKHRKLLREFHHHLISGSVLKSDLKKYVKTHESAFEAQQAILQQQVERSDATYVSNQNYCDFLNAVASSDAHGLYNAALATEGIVRSGEPGSYEYEITNNQGDVPVSSISWPCAARYCNWIENGQGSALSNPSVTEEGVYQLEGDHCVSINTNATHLLPSSTAQVSFDSFAEIGTWGAPDLESLGSAFIFRETLAGITMEEVDAQLELSTIGIRFVTTALPTEQGEQAAAPPTWWGDAETATEIVGGVLAALLVGGYGYHCLRDHEGTREGHQGSLDPNEPPNPLDETRPSQSSFNANGSGATHRQESVLGDHDEGHNSSGERQTEEEKRIEEAKSVIAKTQDQLRINQNLLAEAKKKLGRVASNSYIPGLQDGSTLLERDHKREELEEGVQNLTSAIQSEEIEIKREKERLAALQHSVVAKAESKKPETPLKSHAEGHDQTLSRANKEAFEGLVTHLRNRLPKVVKEILEGSEAMIELEDPSLIEAKDVGEGGAIDASAATGDTQHRSSLGAVVRVTRDCYSRFMVQKEGLPAYRALLEDPEYHQANFAKDIKEEKQGFETTKAQFKQTQQERSVFLTAKQKELTARREEIIAERRRLKTMFDTHHSERTILKGELQKVERHLSFLGAHLTAKKDDRSEGRASEAHEEKATSRHGFAQLVESVLHPHHDSAYHDADLERVRPVMASVRENFSHAHELLALVEENEQTFHEVVHSLRINWSSLEEGATLHSKHLQEKIKEAYRGAMDAFEMLVDAEGKALSFLAERHRTDKKKGTGDSFAPVEVVGNAVLYANETRLLKLQEAHKMKDHLVPIKNAKDEYWTLLHGGGGHVHVIKEKLNEVRRLLRLPTSS